ncbi:Ppx/GppA phosphatase family protein [Ramlibacter sp. MAHUQ-53]|uniref:Ppx/GppA phosphatase family protein n=1 Tax=unclassified Ramlibacter TaxID=2617605 RepID=UPI00362ED3A7
MENGTLLAAIDLGSNSYRLEIGRYEDGQIRRIEYLKETVRQGGGLDDSRNLTEDAMRRGWDCLARFGERLAGFKRRQVRAVATQTLREARNAGEFLAGAHPLLGFPIDVIAGREEARLIFQGVTHLLPQSDERRLVVDIGGRSTEMILGQGYDARVMESYRVGSVAWSQKYFPKGEFTEAAFERAEVAAKAVLDEALSAYPREGWDRAYGSSGTIGAVGDVLAATGWDAGTVSREALEWLRARLLTARRADRLQIEGLKEDRRPVIGGGISVLMAVFDLLQIDTMHVAQGALRHGVLYDLLDREHLQGDLRSATVNRLATRFNVDAAQARRVGQVACHLFGQLRADEAPSEEHERQKHKLSWAAQLHEIGMRIAHESYHKHGAYILDHADAPGFAQTELHRLGLLVLGHRGKLRKLEAAFDDEVLVHQLLCLRLAVILCHARREPNLEGLQLERAGQAMSLRLPPGWAASYPQSAHLLREEMQSWQKASWRFSLVE